MASQGSKEYEELGKKLDLLLGDLGGYIDRTAGLKMTISMKNLCIGLNEEISVLQKKETRGALRKYAEALDESEDVVACYQRIQGCLERLALNANLGMWEAVNNLEAEARLQRLPSSLAAVYNSAKAEQVKRRECTPGTREKELAKLLTWARNKASKVGGVYWMNGMAGTGKTTIACSLCAELEKTLELGASFFCSRLIPECRDVNLIIPSIAYQLARFSVPFRFALMAVLEVDPDVYTRTLKVQFENLLVKPLSQAKNALPADFVVVIDALDECECEDSIGQILDVLLSRANTSDLPVRFLLSSRPESKIYRKMMGRAGYTTDARLVLHDLDAEAVKKDIRTYLYAELEPIGLDIQQLEALVDISGVLFIFASTVARYIMEGFEDMVHQQRLDTILGLSPIPTSSKDKAIDNLYTSILAAVFQNEQIDEVTRTRLKTILDAVVCAQEPMTVDGLASLLSQGSGKHVETLLRRLSSVINIAESNGLVTTLHASFPDYMLDRQRSAMFHCHPAATHARLAQACFEAIKNYSPQFNICGIESSYLCDDQHPELEERATKMVPMYLFYACCYWMIHLGRGQRQNEMGDLLWDFLSNRLLLWMEVLNVRKCVHLGPGIIQQAENWSRTNAYSERTIALAHDVWRFTTMFAGHAVSQSTPHIYISMLPFWPASSPLTEHYKPLTSGPAAIQPRGSAMARRKLALLASWVFGGPVYAVCFSSDGSLVAVAVSRSLYAIEPTTGRNVLGPLSHNGIIRTIAFSPDGTLLATGSEDGNIRVWSSTNGGLVFQQSEAHTSYVISLSFFSNGTHLVSGGNDGAIRVWDMKNGASILEIRKNHHAIMSLSISSDGTRIASGGGNDVLQVWDAQSGGMIIGPLEGHTDRINSVCFSPDCTRLVSGSHDKTVRVWGNLAGPVTVDLLQGHTDQVNSVVFSPDGKYIVSGSRDDTVRIWSTDIGFSCTAVLRGHMDNVLSVAFSPDGTRIVSGSIDETVRAWDTQIYNVADSSLDGHKSTVGSISYSRDGDRILSGSNDGTLCIWAAKSGQLVVGPFTGHTDWVYSACFSPDETRIVSGSSDSTIRWWDTYSGKPVGEPVTGHTGAVLAVCFSPDGKIVASSSTYRTIRLWNAHDHKPIGQPLQEHTGSVHSLCFFPDGSRLASGSEDGTTLVWDVSSRQRILPPFRGHTKDVFSVCVSPDGTRIASGSWDATIRLWDSQTGEASMSPLQGHNSSVTAVQFSQDSRYIVSCSNDKSLRIWDVQTGQAVGDPLLGHTEQIDCCSFSPCGKWIVSGSIDSTIRLWDIAELVGAGISEETYYHNGHLGHQSPAPQSWRLQEDGWVVDSQGRLLTWVPPDLHHVLMSSRNTLLISTDGSFQIEFESSKLGERWTDGYSA